jgi:uncharacterized DUF497 family protein
MVDEALLFEWDEAKSARNLRERGFSFDLPSHMFKDRVLEIEDRRRDYGERRFLAIGQVEGEIFALVYTWRGTIRRIISARRAKRKERDAYHQADPR